MTSITPTRPASRLHRLTLTALVALLPAAVAWPADAPAPRAAAAATAAESPAELVLRGRQATRTDPEASRRLAEQALAALADRPDPDQQVLAHLLLCDYYSERNRAAATREVERARASVPLARRAGLRAALLTCEGEIHQYAGENVQAMALFQQAVAAAEGVADDEYLAEALYQRGYLRGLQGDLAAGLADLRRAIAVFEKLRLPHHVRTATNSVATLYNRMGDYEQARVYYEATLREQQAAGLTREMIVTHHNLGRVHENLRDWDNAQRSFETVLALSREISYGRGEAYGLRGLASVRNARGVPADAIRLLDHASELQRATPDERLRAQILLQRGVALRTLQRPAESVSALQQALQIFRTADSMSEIVATHGELALSLTAVGDWRSAYEHQVQFKAASDRLLRGQLDQRFASLRVEFDTASKDKENALLQREKEATERALAQEQHASNLRAIVGVLLALLALVLGALALRQRRAHERMQALAMTDDLTGLPNRRNVLARMETLLADPDSRCALLIADIDYFKPINDELGHLTGDEVLRAVAGALREAAREPIAIGRLGGEEFVLLVPGLPVDDESAALATAQRIAERLLDQVRTLDVSHWLPARRVTVSIGLTVSLAGDSVSWMLKRADEALYAAKAAGRDRVVVRANGASGAASTDAPQQAPAHAVPPTWSTRLPADTTRAH